MRRKVGQHVDATNKLSEKAYEELKESHQRKIEQLCTRRPSVQVPRNVNQKSSLSKALKMEIIDIFLDQKLKSVLQKKEEIQRPTKPKYFQDCENFTFVLPQSHKRNQFAPPIIASSPVWFKEQPLRRQQRSFNAPQKLNQTPRINSSEQTPKTQPPASRKNKAMKVEHEHARKVLAELGKNQAQNHPQMRTHAR